jgi:Zn-dependent M28 family amino/carboxypeptidase
VLSPQTKGTNAPARGRGYAAPWSTNAVDVPPQIAVASEDYHRLLHLAQQGAKPKIAVELQARFQTNDLQAYNTIAELPGTDLKNEVVMLGAHLDSWHAGTGATDDAAGVAVVMEAVRLLKTLQLQPRRTIRVALWSGEEQGLLGSKAYVTEHFGYYTNLTNSQVAKSPKDQAATAKAKPPATTRKLVRGPEYDRLSAYFNFDNGTGKIRGVYLQGNEAVRPFFRRWLEPLRDLGAETLTIANTGGTDHIPFDGINLPAFQFIQDPVEYSSRTHHSNADVLDRLQSDDLKQAAVIMATFAYQAAMLDDKLPRKTK